MLLSLAPVIIKQLIKVFRITGILQASVLGQVKAKHYRTLALQEQDTPGSTGKWSLVYVNVVIGFHLTVLS